MTFDAEPPDQRPIVGQADIADYAELMKDDRDGEDELGDWSELMQCFARGVGYSWVNRRGDVWMPEGSCTDMGGAIEFFKRIDPKVKHIRTWDNGRLDTEYRLMDEGDDDWRAIGGT